MPIAPTLRDQTDLTVAVMTGARSRPELDVAPEPEVDQHPNHAAGYKERIAQSVERLFGTPVESGSEEMGLFEVIVRSTDTMQNTIARLKMAAYSPDVVVKIPRNACGFLEFYRAQEMIALGRQQAERVLPDLNQ